MREKDRPRVLCVDDERHVLDGLRPHLRRDYHMVAAQSGAEGLALLQKEGPFAVVLSDMRMSGMDGATFLSKVREASPETVRLLLTGQADIGSAIAAVNEGQIFRFLTKPCPPPVLLGAIGAAAEQHRLVTAERVLLSQTLRGCVSAMSQVLALANPAAFGRAMRLKRYIVELGAHLGVADIWALEVAALLSQIGAISLPPLTLERVYIGEELSAAEEQMVARAPQLAQQLIMNIPRMEAVAEVIACQHLRHDGEGTPPGRPVGDSLPLGARMLKIVHDHDLLTSRGLSDTSTLHVMKGRIGWYDPALLHAWEEVRGVRGAGHPLHEVSVMGLRPGMVLEADVLSSDAVLLVARGYVVGPSLLEWLNNLPPGAVREPLLVRVKDDIFV